MKDTLTFTESSLIFPLLLIDAMFGVPNVPLGHGEDVSEWEEKIVLLELEKTDPKQEILRSEISTFFCSSFVCLVQKMSDAAQTTKHKTL